MRKSGSCQRMHHNTTPAMGWRQATPLLVQIHRKLGCNYFLPEGMKLAFGLHTANEMKLKYSLVQDETGTSRVILYVGYMYAV